MQSTTYTVKLTFDTLRVVANLAEASAPIQVLVEDDSDEGEHIVSTPYQTADAGHDERKMARLAVLSMGGEYWQDPSEDYSDVSDADAVDALIVSVTAE